MYFLIFFPKIVFYDKKLVGANFTLNTNFFCTTNTMQIQTKSEKVNTIFFNKVPELLETVNLLNTSSRTHFHKNLAYSLFNRQILYNGLRSFFVWNLRDLKTISQLMKIWGALKLPPFRNFKKTLKCQMQDSQPNLLEFFGKR